jgi:transposase-like protein
LFQLDYTREREEQIMRWDRNLAMVCALGAVVIGGVLLTVQTGASEAAASTQVTMAIQKAVDGEGQDHDLGCRSGYRRGAEGAAVAEQLGIEVETFRDAMRSVIEARQEAGAEKPEEMTAEEREAHRAEFISDVAAELGISAGTLNAAFDAQLAQGIADGKLTESEADEIREAKANGTLHELQQARQVENLGDKLERLLGAGIIDDTQYVALQAELAQSDMEGFQKLMREYREASGFGDDGLRPRDGRGGPDGRPGHGPRHGGDAPDDKGTSL